MSQMILKGKKMIRINPKTKTKIEFSTNQGRSWIARSTSVPYGDFQTWRIMAKKFLGTTSIGLYIFTDEGRSWIKRS